MPSSNVFNGATFSGAVLTNTYSSFYFDHPCGLGTNLIVRLR
jgi:hypothetical protein